MIKLRAPNMLERVGIILISIINLVLCQDIKFISALDDLTV